MTAPDGALSDQTLDRLRITAAMAVAVPHLAMKIRLGDTTCLEVRRTPAPNAAHRVLPPCMLHRAVVDAVQMRRSGERIAMRGVPAGDEPAIDWGVAPGAKILPGGIVRVPDGQLWHHMAAVLVDEDVIDHALEHVPEIASRRDESLGVTLLHGTSPKGDRPASHAITDVLLQVIAQAGADDLERRLNGAVDVPPKRRTWR